MSKYTFENDAILLFDSNRGVYIPNHFATQLERDYISGVDSEDFKTLESGHDTGWYWEAWDAVLNNAVLTIPEKPGTKYKLHHNGDLWAVPEDCEIPSE